MSPEFARNMNALGVLAVCLVLVLAFYFQLVLYELPCPLCLLHAAPAPQPVLHPNMSRLYHSNVSDLANALNEPDVRREAAEALRALIDKVVLTPSEDGYDIDLHGDLAGILALASGKKAKTAQADMAEAVSQISLVAGVGFEPLTFRL